MTTNVVRPTKDFIIVLLLGTTSALATTVYLKNNELDVLSTNMGACSLDKLSLSLDNEELKIAFEDKLQGYLHLSQRLREVSKEKEAALAMYSNAWYKHREAQPKPLTWKPLK